MVREMSFASVGNSSVSKVHFLLQCHSSKGAESPALTVSAAQFLPLTKHQHCRLGTLNILFITRKLNFQTCFGKFSNRQITQDMTWSADVLVVVVAERGSAGKGGKAP